MVYKRTKEHQERLNASYRKAWINRKASGKGVSCWKGKSFSAEHREKLSDAHEGKNLSEATKEKLRGRIPWNKGKRMPEATRQKVIKNSYMRGKKPANYKGGIRVESGYVMILHKKHPFCKKSGYIKRSRLVMEKHIGRYLTSEEVVHHRGIKYPIGSVENKQDDRIENLKLFANNSKHLKFHHPIGNQVAVNKCR